ncbi:MAG: TPM domain-containing protein [Bacteroidota bacterium]
MNKYLPVFLLVLLGACNQPGPKEKSVTKDTIQTTDSLQAVAKNAAPEYYFPEPKGWVNDFEGIFTRDEMTNLDSIIIAHKQQTGNEIAIATVPASYYPKDSLASYSFRLFNQWHIGEKEKNNGVGIILSKANRQVRIETGKGVIQILTNEKVQSIIDKSMIPSFKNGNYFEGTKKAIMDIIKILGKPA